METGRVRRRGDGPGRANRPATVTDAVESLEPPSRGVGHDHDDRLPEVGR